MSDTQQSPSIRFLHEPGMDGVFPAPAPAAKAIPPYFKAIPPSQDGTPMNLTVKRCMPFLDALTAGFIIPLWADLYVQAHDGELTFTFPSNFPQAQSMGFHKPKQMPNHPLAAQPYGQHMMKLINPWLVQTDPGVSVLFTSPLNHMETRLKILDGVVDTDGYYNNVNFPFLWTGGDGDFYIPKGTPLVQVIPFRRETYDMEIGVVDVAARTKTNDLLGTVHNSGYRNMFRHGSPDALDPIHTDVTPT